MSKYRLYLKKKATVLLCFRRTFKDLQNPIVHQIDTRQNATVTVFDGSHEDESKLAKQFWNSVLLMPPVESTLVCKEIHQRTRNRPLHEKNGSLIKLNFFDYLLFSQLI